ncbi:hypothetical protein cyc_00109 [Cyclospora cayetanensis]|uniref:Uncharacterized protein n=1 Tax=Cyclospora cayetanensis TaxID=88456 RepID=A0A1D3CYF4_9EIME|nr:hypothetical protein cyc_00109 [Cyclospora cayetanensis]
MREGGSKAASREGESRYQPRGPPLREIATHDDPLPFPPSLSTSHWLSDFALWKTGDSGGCEGRLLDATSVVAPRP